jgi:hypothetical protein
MALHNEIEFEKACKLLGNQRLKGMERLPGHHPYLNRSGRAAPMNKAPRLLAVSKQETAMTRTLYIRHVPDDVAERLERLASRAGLPLSTFALQELSETARRADNVELLQALPSVDLEAGEILEALRQSRAEH